MLTDCYRNRKLFLGFEDLQGYADDAFSFQDGRLDFDLGFLLRFREFRSVSSLIIKRLFGG